VVALSLPTPAGNDYVEILLLWLAFYLTLRFLRRTIAGGLFRGAGLLVWPVLLGAFVALTLLRLEVVGVLARGALPLLILGGIVVFQTELRHGIARLGQSGLMQRLTRRGNARVKGILPVQEIAAAAFQLREKRIGAIIAIERTMDLSGYVQSGVKIDALVHKDLLTSLFQHEAALHDGAVIIRGGRVVAASCFLPLTERTLDIIYGTRHRAAVGLSEQSDAYVIVTSEERGQVSVARRGELTPFQDPRWLAADLAVVFGEQLGVMAPEPRA
jgi:diadenylate cyclase